MLLDVDAERAWERVGTPETAAGPLGRPLARDREAFVALHGERHELYEQTGRRLPAAAPARRRRARARRAARARGGTARHADAVGAERLGRLSGAARARAAARRRRGRRRAAVAARSLALALVLRDRRDRRRALRRAASAGSPARSRSAPASGTRRSPSAERVWRALVAAGIDRGDHLVALGGGVVGDLAGFCAATYQRGVPVVQVPTTLVAQVDSAYGGKTGVDLPEAKNYVGAYHQPAGVIVDPDTLERLPQAELAAGWVEVLKTALIAGGELWRARRLGRRARRLDDPRLRAHEARGRRRGRARRGPPPGLEPRSHRRARDRDGDRLRALPPRRGGRSRAARRAAPIRRRAAARAGARAAGRSASCRSRSQARASRTSSRQRRATRSASARRCRSCCSRSPASRAPAARSREAELRAAVAELAE